MGIINNIRHKLFSANSNDKTTARAFYGTTTSTGNISDLFTNRKRDTAALQMYRNIYAQGGLISEALDSYPSYLLSKGYEIDGDEQARKIVSDELSSIDLENVIWHLELDAVCVVGEAFAEPVFNRSGTKLVDIRPIPSETIEILWDDYGAVTGYRQYDPNSTLAKSQTFKPDELIHHTIFGRPGRYGIPLVARALDEIKRDTMIAESIANAIKRHGFPKYHISVGREGEDIPEDTIKYIAQQFQRLSVDNEITTPHDVDIKAIDTSGLPNSTEYSNFSLQRLCVALGVPEEVLGLGRGSTEATARVRMDGWYDKIGMHQVRMARTINMQIMPLLNRNVKIKTTLTFPDISPSDEIAKSEFLAKIRTPADPFAILSLNEQREYLGYKPIAEEDDQID